MDASLKNHLDWLVQTYFSDSSRHIRFQKGDVLMKEKEFNDKLYLVISGLCAGYVKNPEGQEQKLFLATQNMFVGVYSYFSKTFKSAATVIAEEDTVVTFIDQNQQILENKFGNSLFEQFMPVVMLNLTQRQQREQRSTFERERTLKKLIQTEKLASLGQMAAGLAHELNNAITVVERNTDWICSQLGKIIDEERADTSNCFTAGVKSGRLFSTREVRKRSKYLKSRFSISEDLAKKLVEMDIPDDLIHEKKDDLEGWAKTMHLYWEMGSTFHDMAVASRHAAYVVKSVKALAVQKSPRKTELDINESIREALALFSSPLRKIQLKQTLGTLPFIEGNMGELVQVWINLIENAIDSMSASTDDEKILEIESYIKNETITIAITDSGSGIPENLKSKILQPNFTTKEKGLEFGLGLGLTIVERIINSYNGEIKIDSKPGCTSFIVTLPVRGEDE